MRRGAGGWSAVTRYPATMPRSVLFGTAREIEAWCAKNDKVRPTLLDLALARKAKK